MWIAQSAEARFWLSGLSELQNRGVKALFIACVDGLNSLPEVIETVYPQTRVHSCMVHLVRNSLRYVSYKHMKAVATDLKAIYLASTESEAAFNLELFAEKWDALYPSSKSWRARLLPGDPVVCLLRRHLQSDLHDQCHWVGYYDTAQGDAQPSHLSLR